MDYWKVTWHHDFVEDPVVFFSEIGSDGYETRKIQQYRDGRLLKADQFHETGEIGLSEIPVGSIEDVVAQAEFSATVITSEEFQAIWDQAAWSR
ncbi:hypothetical protein AB0H73_33670 [Streptomyces olivoreticuli]|uniref:DUF6881 domain-containing protein n=1 Tax=Streptomyces olivoreticuli TaxID=68246 RepID=UPI000E222E67|nr:hypothetical protein [Streptomyces olivoreticuli]